MRNLLLLTLSAGATFAQLPQDTLRTQLYAPTTVKQKFLAETPGAVEERRTEHSVHFRKPDGTRVALISQYLHWRDPETGQMLAVEPALWTLDNGWRLEGGPVKARIVRSGTAWTFELYQQRDDKQWKTISFTIPAPSTTKGSRSLSLTRS
jgi:hypothetical protein